jgi:hypothetical protein
MSMKNYDGKLVGIIGTVIIHLIAGILFMSFQLKSMKKEMSDIYQIEITNVEEDSRTPEKQIELPVTGGVERIFKGDDEMLNIARNLANKPDEKINPADYIDKVKEELIKSGKLGIDNYIDEQKRLNEIKAEGNPATESDTVKKAEAGNSPESQKMAANYKGPTRIYYNLPVRNHLYLPIPIYKCQGSGKVVMSIEVNQKGIVERAVIIANESSTSDPCLLETAIQTALISRFDSDARSPKIQTGTLSYQFMAQ